MKIGSHAAWAMAVGGMIGGGIYTVPGLVLRIGGPFAVLGLALGALIALGTVRSYARLSLARGGDGVPVTTHLRRRRIDTAGVVAWWLVLVYVLALAVYVYTVGHYLGGALGIRPIAVEVAVVALLVALNLRGVDGPAGIQIALVWGQLVVIAALAIGGVARGDVARLAEGAPGPSIGAIALAAAATFVAFEGFEMLAYEVRELRRPRKVLGRMLPGAVVAVAVVYAIVTLAAAALVGAGGVVAGRDRALALAGEAAAGAAGLVVVTAAAVGAGVAAINATLFSVARMVRTAAERGLMPPFCKRVNARDVPHWPTVVLGVLATALAAVGSLGVLVATASLGFLVLFAHVNVTAARAVAAGRRVAWATAAAATGAALLGVVELARTEPLALAGVGALVVAGAVGWAVTNLRHPLAAS